MYHCTPDDSVRDIDRGCWMLMLFIYHKSNVGAATSNHVLVTSIRNPQITDMRHENDRPFSDTY